MTLTHYFLGFSLLAGLAVAAAFVGFPVLQTLNLPGYLYILFAMALFDTICFMRGGGRPGSVVSMPVRFAGFGVALAALLLAAVLLGIEAVVFCFSVF
jgi:hypothetical protein